MRGVRSLPAPVQGALYMSGAALGFSLMNLIIRLTARELSPLEIAFFRNLFAFLFLLPWAWRVGVVTSLRTAHRGRHVIRALVGLLAMLTWFTAVAMLPMAQAVALNFTAPLFATIGAALFLGETVRARRWSATVIGFLGTLVILRPGLTETSALTLLPILAAGLMACATLIVKSLSRYDHPNTIVLYMNLILTPVSLVPALFVWRWPAPGTFALLVALGLLAAVSHMLLTRSYVKADASAVQPFDYARLPFVALLGYLVFGEVPSPWILPGGALIVGSAIYITHREAKVARATRGD